MARNFIRAPQKPGSALARRSGLLRAGLALLIGALCLLVAAPALAGSPSSDASLSSLSASRTTDLVTYTDLAFGPGGDVPPWPDPADYIATAPADTAYVRLIPQAGHAGATISVGMPSFTDLQTVVSGQPSGVFKLSFAENWFSIYVSAEDGTTNHYRAMIFRKGSDANRVNLSLAGRSTDSDGISSGGSVGGANGADPPKTTSPDRGAETLTVTRSAEQTETQQQQSSGTPGPVTGLEVSVDGNKLIVSWQAPELGGPPDSYIVHIKPQGGGKGQTKRPQATKQSVTFRKLELGRTYKVWVRAKNEAGKGERTHATATLLIVK